MQLKCIILECEINYSIVAKTVISQVLPLLLFITRCIVNCKRCMINNTRSNAYTYYGIKIKRVIVMSWCKFHFAKYFLAFTECIEYSLLTNHNQSRGNHHLLLQAYQRHRLPLNHIVDIDIRKSINDSHSHSCLWHVMHMALPDIWISTCGEISYHKKNV